MKSQNYKKLISVLLSITLLFSSTTATFAAAVKSKAGAGKGDNGKGNKSKNLDRQYGEAGTLKESKEALISVDALALQNYADSQEKFDFSTYKKVTLKSVILEAISKSNIIKSSREKVIQTNLSLKDAYADYLPLLDFQYTHKKTKNEKYTDDDSDNLNADPHINIEDENYGFRVRQSLYSGGSTALKIKSLEAKSQEAKRKHLIVIEQVIQNAIKAYFGVLFSYRTLQVNEKNMKQLVKILEITQIKFDSGALSIGDLSAVKANIANSNSKLIRVKSSLADALDYYNYLLESDFSKTNPYQTNFVTKLDTLENLHKIIINNNLSLLNYRLNIDSIKYKMLNIKASFKPKVDLELSYKNVLGEENFVANKETYYAKLTMSYIIYNAGKDTRKMLTANSSLKELKHRYQEQIKKIKWETQKLYNSTISLQETIKSTVEEVSASNEMIDAYWEGFQLGEQDLQVLLQAQRQLNSAELDLIKFKKDYLTNIFKLEKEKGNLSAYFGINAQNPNLIDFTNTEHQDSLAQIDLSKQNEERKKDIQNNIQNKDLNQTIDTYLELVKEPTFEDIINFKDSFLVAKDDDYTLVISDFTNNYSAFKYIKENRLLEEAFSYEYFDKDGVYIAKKSIDKVVSVKTNIAYGIYTNKEEALKAKDNITNTINKKQFTAVSLFDVKKAYNRYIEGLETVVEPYIIKPKIIKTFVTNQDFKKEFLSAPDHYFSINIVSFSKIKSAVSLIKKEGIEDNSLVFKYGRNGEWIKVMMGAYPTYSQAFEALSQHPDMINKYHPIIEKINQKQKLYKKYAKYNYLPKWYKDEQKKLKDEKNKVEKTDQQIKEDILENEALKEKKLAKAKKLQALEKLAEEKIVQEKLKLKAIEDKRIADEKIALEKDNAIKEAKKTADANAKKEAMMQEQRKIMLEEEKNTPKNKPINNKKYTIHLGTVTNKNEKAFIRRYIIGSDYKIIKVNSNSKIIQGTYASKEEALEAMKNIHPRLLQKAKIVQIENSK